MTIEISELPPEVEEFARAKAAERGNSVAEYVRLLVMQEAEKQQAFAPVRETSRGALAHLNMRINDEDIEDVRKEMWQNFPRDIS